MSDDEVDDGVDELDDEFDGEIDDEFDGEHDGVDDDEYAVDDEYEDDADDADADDADADDEPQTVDDATRALLRAPRPGNGPIQRLYRGETHFDFVGRRRLWFTISTIIIVAGIISIILRGGLNLGIEFKGGTQWTVKAPGVTQVEVVNAVQGAGLNEPIVQLLGHGTNQQLNVQADLNQLSPAARAAETMRVEEALAKLTNTSVDNIQNGVENVGPTWGSTITDKAIEALITFFIAVGIYISIRFEPKMALAAFIAMVHDVLVAVGIYSLFNFQVTPDTVVAILTILGYSLYDTVVVFDRVRDNTKNIGSSGRITYNELINLSMNQTLARSINTSAVAIIPVLSVLLIGAQFLGASTLQEYGLALFVGLLSGAYSSIFIAAPILAMMKSREPRWIAIERRLATRSDRAGDLSPAAAAALTTQMSIAAGGQPAGGKPSKRTGPIRPGSATGTAVLDRPPGSGDGARQPPRPRKGKRKRKR